MFFNLILQIKFFIESFAGSGSIGLEAISRDAKKSLFLLNQIKIHTKILTKKL